MSLRAQSLKDIFTFTRASTATYFDINGLLATAAVDEPRIDYDPATLACRGLLIEDQRTNLLLSSATFATQSVTVTNVPHTLSFYGTGSIALTGTASPEVSLVGAGWTTRAARTFTPTAGTLTLTLTGSAIYAQLEAGPHATSWIATTSAPVTRATDACYTTTLEPWFSETEGTLYSEYMIPYAHNAGDTAFRYITNATSDSGLNRHIGAYIYGGNRYSVTSAGGASQAEFDTGAFTAWVVQKQAYAWAANDCMAYASGGYSGSDTSATMPSGLVNFYLGATTGQPNGYIRKVKFYPRRLSNTELAALVA
jgi:hypothetical protein